MHGLNMFGESTFFCLKVMSQCLQTNVFVGEWSVSDSSSRNESYLKTNSLMLVGCRVGQVVSALASHTDEPGSNPAQSLDFSKYDTPVHPAVQNGYLTLFRVGEGKAGRERR